MDAYTLRFRFSQGYSLEKMNDQTASNILFEEGKRYTSGLNNIGIQITRALAETMPKDGWARVKFMRKPEIGEWRLGHEPEPLEMVYYIDGGRVKCRRLKSLSEDKQEILRNIHNQAAALYNYIDDNMDQFCYDFGPATAEQDKDAEIYDTLIIHTQLEEFLADLVEVVTPREMGFDE